MSAKTWERDPKNKRLHFIFSLYLIEREKNHCFISPEEIAGLLSCLRDHEAQARAALGPGISSAASLAGALPLK